MTADKGRSVATVTPFSKGDFVCTYDGEMILAKEAKRRDKEYGEDKGCFLFYFKHNGKDLWLVDAADFI